MRKFLALASGPFLSLVVLALTALNASSDCVAYECAQAGMVFMFFPFWLILTMTTFFLHVLLRARGASSTKRVLISGFAPTFPILVFCVYMYFRNEVQLFDFWWKPLLLCLAQALACEWGWRPAKNPALGPEIPKT